MHDGHRERLRQRYRTQGLDSLQDHEVLELLLYYAIPRRDTNPIAHRLMDKFGSLVTVLQADEAALCAVEGVGENSATLLTLFRQVARRMQLQMQQPYPYVGTLSTALAYLRALFFGLQIEALYMLCLDAGCHVRNPVKLSEGAVDYTTFSTRLLAEAALRHRAASVLLAHNHPGNTPMPSPQDIKATHAAVRALSTVQVGVLDHIILCGDDYYSFARSIQQAGESSLPGNIGYLSKLPPQD